MAGTCNSATPARTTVDAPINHKLRGFRPMRQSLTAADKRFLIGALPYFVARPMEAVVHALVCESPRLLKRSAIGFNSATPTARFLVLVRSN